MIHLTDSEKRDAIKLIEAGKPLPDKFRFLLFDDKREVELVWNGKTNETTNVVLPFQVIEEVDEPRAEKPDDTNLQMSLFDVDARGRQLKGWTNKLIWGDNKLILSSLKNGPMREEIEKQGGIKLIYIDPPFDVGADFSMDIEIGDDTFTKKPNILEEIAYRDTWGKGADSFIAMIYERLVLMRDLLAEDGSIYVHCDWRVNSYIRLILEEIFGKQQYRAQIVWRSSPGHSDKELYSPKQNHILFFSKSEKVIWNQHYQPYDDEYLEQHFQKKEPDGRIFEDHDLTAYGLKGGGYTYEWKGHTKLWRCPKVRMEEYEAQNRIYYTRNGLARYKRYLDEMPGTAVSDIWDDIPRLNSQSKERTGYDTQKPEALIKRVIEISSNENDLVADFFTGSGTTAAVAEKLGRKWIVSDLGKFAVHTTRKRMIGVQRQLKDEGKDYRAFEILNLGKYERQHFIGVNVNLREAEQHKQLQQKEAAFIELILRAYRAEQTGGFLTFHGKKAGRLVAIGPVNLPVTRLFVEEVILECRQKHITRVDILGFEFEMGLFPNVLDEARSKGIDIAPKYIPAEVFDKRAVEKNQVVFHDVAFIEVKPHVKDAAAGKLPQVAVELTDFSVFYSQDSVRDAETSLKNGASKIVVEKGQIIKVTKDKNGITNREQLTGNWTDWIDYWAVDFNFESKREIVRVKSEDTGEWEERWTGDYIFENEWQSFRTKKDRSLELKSVFHEAAPGRRKLAVKVVDIFGNDTMTIVDLALGGKK